MSNIWKDIQRRVGVNPDGDPGTETAKAVAKALGLKLDKTYTMADANAFFMGIRKITGPLDGVQVDIINRLLTSASTWSIGWIAYGLATAWHESKLRPIKEIGLGKGHAYGVVNSTGKAPYGRGLVQITWDANYQTIDKALGLGGRLAANYDLALDPEIAVKALVIGMEKGLYTGRGLGHYIVPGLGTHTEFVKARKIINSTDRAEMIADYADDFKTALLAGGWA